MNGPPAIEIVDPGLLATIQDRGRKGMGALGVSPSGFADWLSAQAANKLVGNRLDAALIETTVTGLEMKALRAIRIAVTGAKAPLSVNGAPRSLWRSLRVPSGAVVKISAAQNGLRSYIAVYGGIELSPTLGSSSTDITAGFGGLHGRALARGDRLDVREIEGELPENDSEFATQARPVWRQPAVLGVLRGPHAARVSAQNMNLLSQQTYVVSARSNRQGVRLEGAPLVDATFDAVSTGVCAGCVQVANDGMPIILLADHQTTGGYVVALVVSWAHIPDVAQLRPGDRVRFNLITQVEAAHALVHRVHSLTLIGDDVSH